MLAEDAFPRNLYLEIPYGLVRNSPLKMFRYKEEPGNTIGVVHIIGHDITLDHCLLQAFAYRRDFPGLLGRALLMERLKTTLRISAEAPLLEFKGKPFLDSPRVILDTQ